MIKINKDHITVMGDIEVVAAEYMSITAYMAETFGIDGVLNMIELALEEVKEVDHETYRC